MGYFLASATVTWTQKIKKIKKYRSRRPKTRTRSCYQIMPDHIDPSPRPRRQRCRLVVCAKTCPTETGTSREKVVSSRTSATTKQAAQQLLRPTTRGTSIWPAQVVRLSWPKGRKGWENPVSVAAPQPTPTCQCRPGVLAGPICPPAPPARRLSPHISQTPPAQ